MTTETLWGELHLNPDEPVHLTVGALRIQLKRMDDELWLFTERDDRPQEGDGEWRRWAVPAAAAVRVRPASPDRLLVVSHELPFHLPSRGHAKVYVRIPLSVQVLVTGSGLQDLVVVDEPSHMLSDTWWGTREEGELAYWLTTKARAQVSADLFVPHIAMCTVHLENHSEESLPVDKFAVRAPHLSMFEREGRMWTDEVKVRYQAASEGSEIHFGRRPPRDEPAGTLLAGPRVPVRKGFQARTFDRLRTLAELGG